MQYLRSIKAIDIFSEEIGFEVNQSKIYKSYFGASLSIIVIITCIVLAIMFGQEIYKRKSPTTSVSSNFLPNSKILLGDQIPLFFEFKHSDASYIENLNKYVEGSFNRFNFSGSNIDLIFFPDPMARCNRHDLRALEGKVTEEQISIYLNAQMYCFNFNNESLVMNPYGTSHSSFINFNFFACNKTDTSKNCAKDIDETLSEFYIIMYFLNNYVDFNEYENPLVYYVDSVSTQITNTALKRTYAKFYNDELLLDNGWLLDTTQTINFVSFEAVTEINNISALSPLSMYWIT